MHARPSEATPTTPMATAAQQSPQHARTDPLNTSGGGGSSSGGSSGSNSNINNTSGGDAGGGTLVVNDKWYLARNSNYVLVPRSQLDASALHPQMLQEQPHVGVAASPPHQQDPDRSGGSITADSLLRAPAAAASAIVASTSATKPEKQPPPQHQQQRQQHQKQRHANANVPCVLLDRGAATMMKARRNLQAVSRGMLPSDNMRSYRKEKLLATQRFMMEIGAVDVVDDPSGPRGSSSPPALAVLPLPPGGGGGAGAVQLSVKDAKAFAMHPAGQIVGPTGIYKKIKQLSHGAFGATHLVEWHPYEVSSNESTPRGEGGAGAAASSPPRGPSSPSVRSNKGSTSSSKNSVSGGSSTKGKKSSSSPHLPPGEVSLITSGTAGFATRVVSPASRAALGASASGEDDSSGLLHPMTAAAANTTTRIVAPQRLFVCKVGYSFVPDEDARREEEEEERAVVAASDVALHERRSLPLALASLDAGARIRRSTSSSSSGSSEGSASARSIGSSINSSRQRAGQCAIVGGAGAIAKQQRPTNLLFKRYGDTSSASISGSRSGEDDDAKSNYSYKSSLSGSPKSSPTLPRGAMNESEVSLEDGAKEPKARFSAFDQAEPDDAVHDVAARGGTEAPIALSAQNLVEHNTIEARRASGELGSGGDATAAAAASASAIRRSRRNKRSASANNAAVVGAIGAVSSLDASTNSGADAGFRAQSMRSESDNDDHHHDHHQQSGPVPADDEDSFRGGVVRPEMHRRVNHFIRLQNNPDDLKGEATMLSNLAHPNIVAYCDSFVYQRQRHLILEYVEGKTLAQEIELQQEMKMPRLTSRGVAVRAVQLLLALEYLARHGCMHRDVKPTNMIVTRRQVLKLLDFGFSRFPGTGSGSAMDQLSYTRLATPDYAAPEVLRGGTAFTTRADCYSAGVCIWEMIALELPYAAKNIPDLLKMMRHRAYTTMFPMPPPLTAAEMAAEQRRLAQWVSGGRQLRETQLMLDAGTDDGQIDVRLVRLAQGLIEIDPAKRLSAKAALETPVMQEALALYLQHFEALASKSPSTVDQHWVAVLRDHAAVLQRDCGAGISSLASQSRRERQTRHQLERAATSAMPPPSSATPKSGAGAAAPAKAAAGTKQSSTVQPRSKKQ